MFEVMLFFMLAIISSSTKELGGHDKDRISTDVIAVFDKCASEVAFTVEIPVDDKLRSWT